MQRGLGRALLLAALAFSCQTLAAGKSHRISIEGMKFVPERVEVAVGDNITWTNRDFVPHTVTAGKSVESGTIEPNKSWRYVVHSKGEIDYICRFHPVMHGVVVAK